MTAKCSFFAVCLLFLNLIGLCYAPDKGAKDPLLSYELQCDPETHYCYQAFEEYVLYEEAWFSCHSRGMHMAMPRTQKQYDFIRNNILGTTTDHESVWIGLTTSDDGLSWTWQDMRTLDTSGMTDPWKTGKPTSVHHSKDTAQYKGCVAIQTDGWSNEDCNAKTYQYLCESYTNGCDTDAPYQYGAYCYSINTTVDRASTDRCATGQLAIPTTDAINSYLYDINYGDVEFWIGLYRPKGSQTTPFQWMDGTAIDAVYLETHVVDNSSLVREKNKAQYVYMTHSGLWDTTFSGPDLAYVCQIPLSTVDCGPLAIENGQNITFNTTEGNSHSVMCNNGFVSTDPKVTCLSNGTWYPQASCVFDCGPLAFENGQNITFNTTEGNSHSVMCNNGFVSTDPKVTCLSNGTWYPQASCVFDNVSFCPCYANTTNSTSNTTLDEMIADLILDSSQLSKTRRQMTSADDDRISAKCLGVSGATILVAFFSLFILWDVMNYFSLSISQRPISVQIPDNVDHTYC